MRLHHAVRFIAVVLLLQVRHTAAAQEDPSGTIIFRGRQTTFNTTYDFHAADGQIRFRPRNDTAAAWKIMPLHKRLKKVREISADSDILLALDDGNRIFTMFGALSRNTDDFSWWRRWGMPFRMGNGMTVPADHKGWDLSSLSKQEDIWYRARNGNKYDVGQGCTNIYFLDNTGRRIIYLDPWLPNDHSYQVGMPYRGRFIARSLSSSGSTIFIINRYGDMYTRTYDFDMVGADKVFFNYSWHEDEYSVADTVPILPRKRPRPLPVPGWTMQPKINGVITDRISIHKVGPGTVYRTLLVEGKDGEGRNGYFTKDISDSAWRFVKTGRSLKGTMLENSPQDRSRETLGPDESIAYRMQANGLTSIVPDFHPYCTPAQCTVRVKGEAPLPLLFHYHESVRLFKREAGVTDDYLPLKGALEMPADLWDKRDTLPDPYRALIREVFGRRRFSEVDIKVKRKRLVLKNPFDFTWKLDAAD